MGKAVVLVSGGLDSAVTLALARASAHECYALTIAYGQRHAVEIAAAERVAQAIGVEEQKIISFDLSWTRSSLVGAGEVPKDRSTEEIGQGVPSTYVPARNLVFLSLASAWAASIDAQEIWIGANAVDYSGYPDCRFEFIAAFGDAVCKGVEGSPKLKAPLVFATKADIIRIGCQHHVPFALTHSCYDPIGDLACGRCDSCRIRRDGFIAAGMEDPTRYAERAA